MLIETISKSLIVVISKWEFYFGSFTFYLLSVILHFLLLKYNNIFTFKNDVIEYNSNPIIFFFKTTIFPFLGPIIIDTFLSLLFVILLFPMFFESNSYLILTLIENNIKTILLLFLAYSIVFSILPFIINYKIFFLGKLVNYIKNNLEVFIFIFGVIIISFLGEDYIGYYPNNTSYNKIIVPSIFYHFSLIIGIILIMNLFNFILIFPISIVFRLILKMSNEKLNSLMLGTFIKPFSSSLGLIIYTQFLFN